MSEYTKQANDFLKKTNTKFSVKFLKHDYHFAYDDKTRDIFKVTFSREGKSFSLRFGQSINDSTGQGDNPPTAYDVLACLTKYEVASFENFCSDFGYNDGKLSEYPKVKKIYNACLKEYNNVMNLWSDVIEELQNIQ